MVSRTVDEWSKRLEGVSDDEDEQEDHQSDDDYELSPYADKNSPLEGLANAGLHTMENPLEALTKAFGRNPFSDPPPDVSDPFTSAAKRATKKKGEKAGPSSSTSSSPTATSSFPIGTRVELHSLKGKPELNGRIGEVASKPSRQGRVDVRLDDGSAYNFSTENLIPPPPPASSGGGAFSAFEDSTQLAITKCKASIEALVVRQKAAKAVPPEQKDIKLLKQLKSDIDQAKKDLAAAEQRAADEELQKVLAAEAQQAEGERQGQDAAVAAAALAKALEEEDKAAYEARRAELLQSFEQAEDDDDFDALEDLQLQLQNLNFSAFVEERRASEV